MHEYPPQEQKVIFISLLSDDKKKVMNSVKESKEVACFHIYTFSRTFSETKHIHKEKNIPIT